MDGPSVMLLLLPLKTIRRTRATTTTTSNGTMIVSISIVVGHSFHCRVLSFLIDMNAASPTSYKMALWGTSLPQPCVGSIKQMPIYRAHRSSIFVGAREVWSWVVGLYGRPRGWAGHTHRRAITTNNHTSHARNTRSTAPYLFKLSSQHLCPHPEHTQSVNVSAPRLSL